MQKRKKYDDYARPENLVNINERRKVVKQKSKNVTIIPRNTKQEEYIDMLFNYNKKLIFAVGPAGTGKTMLAVQFAIKEMLDGNIDKILITRPAVTADEDHGFLPGTLMEKMAPWTRPIFDVFAEYYTAGEIEEMIRENVVEVCPVAYARGRAEPVSTMIPTPSGQIRMGDIKVGDYVYGANGKPTLVTGVFPQGIKEMVDITFSDGVNVRCSKDHLWNTRTLLQRSRNLPFTTKTTREIQATIKNKHNQKLHEIPIISHAIEMKEVQVPLDPYVLGCIIGDGTISGGTIHFCTADEELVERIAERLPTPITIKKNKSSITGYDYYITGVASNQNEVKNAIRELGLWGCKSVEKFVPSLYLNNSVDVRLNMLRGLMDTDGSVFNQSSKSNRTQFYSTSTNLANSVKWIVESLGGTATIRTKITPKNGTHTSGFGHNYDMNVVNIVLPPNINPFLLSRKAKMFKPTPVKRLISNVVDAGSEECQCISVAATDHLYLTNNFIVTHNTFKNALVIVDEAQNLTIEQTKMIVTRLGDNARMVVNGDINQCDLQLKDGKQNGLADILAKTKSRNSKMIGAVIFNKQHIERSDIVAEIVGLYGDE